MSRFNTNVTNGHDQISLSGLKKLEELAGLAATPYINGYGYSGTNGTALLQAGPDNITAIVGSFINTSDVTNYPAFSQITINSLTVDGSLGLLFSQDGNGNNTLGIQPASATTPGTITTGVQQIAGNKEFLGRPQFDKGLLALDVVNITGSLVIGTLQNPGGVGIYGDIGVDGNSRFGQLGVNYAVEIVKYRYGYVMNFNNAFCLGINIPGGGFTGCPINLIDVEGNATPAFTGTVPAGKSLTVINGFIVGYQ